MLPWIRDLLTIREFNQCRTGPMLTNLIPLDNYKFQLGRIEMEKAKRQPKLSTITILLMWLSRTNSMMKNSKYSLFTKMSGNNSILCSQVKEWNKEVVKLIQTLCLFNKSQKTKMPWVTLFNISLKLNQDPNNNLNKDILKITSSSVAEAYSKYSNSCLTRLTTKT